MGIGARGIGTMKKQNRDTEPFRGMLRSLVFFLVTERPSCLPPNASLIHRHTFPFLFLMYSIRVYVMLARGVGSVLLRSLAPFIDPGVHIIT